MSTEEERATEYRRTMISRVRNDLAADRALRGDPATRRELLEHWAPLALALEERR